MGKDIKLDLRRQIKAWNMAMKKLPKKTREKLQTVHDYKLLANISPTAAGVATLLGNPAMTVFLAPALGSAMGAGLLLSRASEEEQKFIKIYHKELEKLRKENEKKQKKSANGNFVKRIKKLV